MPADRSYRVLLALGVLGALAVGAAALAGAPSPLSWRAIRQDFALTVEAPGEVRAAVMTQVTSPVSGVADASGMMSGRAVVWLAPQGAAVHSGDVIARLDTEDLEDLLLNADGIIATARAGLASAQASLSRTKADVGADLKDLEAKLRVAEAKAALEESRPLPEDRKAAEAAVAEADAEARFAAYWFESTRRLFDEGVVSGDDVTAARHSDEQARIKQDAAHQALDELLKGAERSLLETARAEREQARLSLEEARGSKDKKIAQAQTQLTGAENGLKDAERNKVQLQKDLESATVRAPHDGVIFPHAGQKLEIGDTVSRGESLLDLAEASSLYFAARVRESDSTVVRTGQRAQVRLLSNAAAPLQGTVSKVGTALSDDAQASGMRYLEVEIKPQDVPAALRPGLTGRCVIQVKNVANAVVVPLSAIRDGAVTVLGPHGPARRAVSVSANDGTMAAIASGLAEGEVVSLQEE